MLPPIPYNGVLRPTLMLIGMAAMFLLLQRTRGKPYYGRAAAGIGWHLSAILLYATLFSRTAREEYSYRVEPLIMLRQAFTVGWDKAGKPAGTGGIVVNLLLTLPIGYLLAACSIDCRQGGASGAGVSLCIELIQLITPAGMFELDDLIYNTLGVALGYGCWSAWRSARASGCADKTQQITTEERSIA